MRSVLHAALAAALLLSIPLRAHADELFDQLAAARQQCGGRATALRQQPQLDDAARRLSRGGSLQSAMEASGYRAKRSFEWALSGYQSPQAVAQALVQKHCAVLGSADLTDVGAARIGNSYWIIAAAPFTPPEQAQSGEVASRVLALVNQARAQPRRCGNESFGSAQPVALEPRLTQAATEHAQSMARFSYLEHHGRDGSDPADRVTRAGYDWRSVGENIAMGQTTPEQVVQEWLKSPEHCANIMQPRFIHMGIAFAVNKASEGGVYWAQSFGLPR
jgi:uncharacterized protein YkwD